MHGKISSDKNKIVSRITSRDYPNKYDKINLVFKPNLGLD